MDILIRNVRKSTIAKIDEKAKSCGLSREAFLRDFFEFEFLSEKAKDEQKRLLTILATNTECLKELIYKTDKIEEKIEKQRK